MGIREACDPIAQLLIKTKTKTIRALLLIMEISILTCLNPYSFIRDSELNALQNIGS